jgi:hypothetical protein
MNIHSCDIGATCNPQLCVCVSVCVRLRVATKPGGS